MVVFYTSIVAKEKRITTVTFKKNSSVTIQGDFDEKLQYTLRGHEDTEI